MFTAACTWAGRFAFGLSIRAQATVLGCFALRRAAAGSSWDQATMSLYDLSWTLIAPLAWAPLAVWVAGAALGYIALHGLSRPSAVAAR